LRVFGEDLLLFRKTWFSLSGIFSDLVEHQSPDIPLLGCGLRRFLAELPARLLALSDSRSFSTHISNADVLLTGASVWLSSVRYWTRCWGHGMAVAGIISHESIE